jgi:hypothetical protein
MTSPTILGYGVFLIGMLFVAFARPPRRRLQAADQQPDSGSLAGVPRHILHSDRSGPGTVLRDTLMTRPSRDEP